jgi:hypothetical protein
MADKRTDKDRRADKERRSGDNSSHTGPENRGTRYRRSDKKVPVQGTQLVI